MQYSNLQQLLQGSSSARRFFCSLPVSVQVQLHHQGQWIRTAEQLHRNAWMDQRVQQLSHRPSEHGGKKKH